MIMTDCYRIQPTQFIRPVATNHFTRQEMRNYIRNQLRFFLTESDLIRDPSNPPHRLIALGRLLGTTDLYDIGSVALTICQSYLDVADLEYDEEPDAIHDMALGFILRDRFADNKTIHSLWYHSPFEALRRAPMLPSLRPSIDEILDRFVSELWQMDVVRVASVAVFMVLFVSVIWSVVWPVVCSAFSAKT